MNTLNKIIFSVSCACIISIIAFDKFYLHNYIFNEGIPTFSFIYLIRSLIIFISIIGLSWSLIGRRRLKLIIVEGNRISLEQVSILLVHILSVITILLFIFKPYIFSTLSHEDNIVEYGSSILLFGCFFITAFSLKNNIQVFNNSKLIKLSIGLLSVLFFIMAMEEISWFQRILNIENPQLFNANLQGEMNLHNFSTNYVENAFYFGTFTFLVLLPFLRFLFPSILNNDYFEILIPRPFIGVIGSIACAYNFDMWTIIFTQIAFFSSLVILSVFYIFSHIRNEKHIILFTIILITITQVLFLNFGENFERIWEVTEYKEFFIALVLFVYSCDVYFRTKTKFLLKSE
jgi:hypothetical protein